jgi:hypothetical protein
MHKAVRVLVASVFLIYFRDLLLVALLGLRVQLVIQLLLRLSFTHVTLCLLLVLVLLSMVLLARLLLLVHFLSVHEPIVSELGIYGRVLHGALVDLVVVILHAGRVLVAMPFTCFGRDFLVVAFFGLHVHHLVRNHRLSLTSPLRGNTA